MAKAWMWIVGIAIVLLVLSPNLLSNIFGGLGGSSTTTTTPSQAVNNIVTSSTALTIASVDKYQQGTAVGATSYIAVNGAAYKTGVTTVSPKDTLSILLVNGSAYHTAYIPTYTVPNAPTAVVSAEMKGNATVTITVFNNNNLAMTAGGGATNQTVASGGAYNMQIRVDGQDKKSTQDMRCILESSDNTKSDSMTLTGLGATFIGKSKPSSYTLAATTSQVWVYDVSAIEGATSATGTIGITSKTGQTLAGTYFKITCKSKEYFIDSLTGKVMYDIEDTSGTNQAYASYSFTGYFT